MCFIKCFSEFENTFFFCGVKCYIFSICRTLRINSFGTTFLNSMLFVPCASYQCTHRMDIESSETFQRIPVFPKSSAFPICSILSLRLFSLASTCVPFNVCNQSSKISKYEKLNVPYHIGAT